MRKNPGDRKSAALSVEFPPELAKRVRAAAAEAELSEQEWMIRAILSALPSNWADEVEKLKGLLSNE